MHEDNRTVEFQDLSDVLHAAQLRRSADLASWLRQYIQNRQLAHQQGKMHVKHAAATQSGVKLVAH